MNYDITELEYINHINGFDIRYNDKDRFEYVVCHPAFNTVYADAFQTISEAEEFCREESVEEWYEILKEEIEWDGRVI